MKKTEDQLRKDIQAEFKDAWDNNTISRVSMTDWWVHLPDDYKIIIENMCQTFYISGILRGTHMALDVVENKVEIEKG